MGSGTSIKTKELIKGGKGSLKKIQEEPGDFSPELKLSKGTKRIVKFTKKTNQKIIKINRAAQTDKTNMQSDKQLDPTMQQELGDNTGGISGTETIPPKTVISGGGEVAKGSYDRSVPYKATTSGGTQTVVPDSNEPEKGDFKDRLKGDAEEAGEGLGPLE
jgi:hypothetical protein